MISFRTNIPQDRKESTQLYEEGFKKYLARDWDKSIQYLRESIKARGKKDKAALQLIERCEMYRANPPEDTWDGVFTRTHK
jgi:adenylate cyclase